MYNLLNWRQAPSCQHSTVQANTSGEFLWKRVGVYFVVVVVLFFLTDSKADKTYPLNV